MADYRMPDGRILNVPDDISDKDYSDLLVELSGIYPDKFGQYAPERSVGGHAGEFLKGIPRGFGTSLVTAAEGIAGLVTPGFDTGVERALRSGRKYWEEDTIFAADPAYSDSYSSQLGSGLGSFASFLIPGGAAKLIGSAGKGLSLAAKSDRINKIAMRGAYGIAVPMGMGEQIQRVEAAREAGTDVSGMQEFFSTVLGGAVGATEVLPIFTFLRGLKGGDIRSEKLRRLLLEAAKQGGVEGAQEAVAGLAQDAIQSGVYDPSIEIGDSMFAEFKVGAGVGAIAETAMRLINRKGTWNSAAVQRKRDRIQEEIQKFHGAEAEAAGVPINMVGGIPLADPRRLLPSPETVTPEQMEELEQSLSSAEAGQRFYVRLNEAGDYEIIDDSTDETFLNFGVNPEDITEEELTTTSVPWWPEQDQESDLYRTPYIVPFGKGKFRVVDPLLRETIGTYNTLEEALPHAREIAAQHKAETLSYRLTREGARKSADIMGVASSAPARAIGEKILSSSWNAVSAKQLSDAFGQAEQVLKGNIGLDELIQKRLSNVGVGAKGSYSIQEAKKILPKESFDQLMLDMAQQISEKNARMPNDIKSGMATPSEVKDQQKQATQDRRKKAGPFSTQTKVKQMVRRATNIGVDFDSPAFKTFAENTVGTRDWDKMSQSQRVLVSTRLMQLPNVGTDERSGVSLTERAAAELAAAEEVTAAAETRVTEASRAKADVADIGKGLRSEASKKQAKKTKENADARLQAAMKEVQKARTAERALRKAVLARSTKPFPLPDFTPKKYSYAQFQAALAIGGDNNGVITIKSLRDEGLTQVQAKQLTDDLIASGRAQRVGNKTVLTKIEAVYQAEQAALNATPRVERPAVVEGDEQTRIEAVTDQPSATGPAVEEKDTTTREPQTAPLPERQRIDVLLNAVREHLKGSGLNQWFDSVIVPTISGRSEGLMDPFARKVMIALDRVDKTKPIEDQVKQIGEVLTHEDFHAFSELDLLTEREWNSLTRFVTTGAGRGRYYEPQRLLYTKSLTEQGLSGAELDQAIVEEAIAEAYREWSIKEKDAPPTVRKSFQKILDASWAFMRGGMDAGGPEAVFERMDAGLDREPGATILEPEAVETAEVRTLREPTRFGPDEIAPTAGAAAPPERERGRAMREFWEDPTGPSYRRAGGDPTTRNRMARDLEEAGIGRDWYPGDITEEDLRLMSPEGARLIRALRRDDFLGFDNVDQMFLQIFDEGIEGLDASQGTKAALGRYVNQYEGGYEGGPNMRGREMRVYHGTGAAPFERFDLTKIGTGEGVQAYGWGLYFSSSKDVAEWYKKQLTLDSGRIVNQDGETVSGRDLFPGETMEGPITRGFVMGKAMEALKDNALDVDAALSSLEENDIFFGLGVPVKLPPETVDKVRSLLEGVDTSNLRFIEPEEGHVYEAEIPEQEDMLDWDKPISEQSEKIQDIAIRSQLSNADITPDQDGYESAYKVFSHILQDLTGRRLYYKSIPRETLVEDAPELASRTLNSLGIPGVTYIGRESGERNFVVFDDAAIQMIEKETGVEEAARPQVTDDFMELPEQTRAEEAIAKKLVTDPDSFASLPGRAKLVTETEEWKGWFEGSKIVNDKGDPLVVFHGTRIGGAEAITPGRTGAIYTTGDPDYAARYGDSIRPLYLSLKNPLFLEDIPGNGVPELYEALERQEKIAAEAEGDVKAWRDRDRSRTQMPAADRLRESLAEPKLSTVLQRASEAQRGVHRISSMAQQTIPMRRREPTLSFKFKKFVNGLFGKETEVPEGMSAPGSIWMVSPDLRYALENMGYDGIVGAEGGASGYTSPVYVAFRPDQVMSIWDNAPPPRGNRDYLTGHEEQAARKRLEENLSRAPAEVADLPEHLHETHQATVERTARLVYEGTRTPPDWLVTAFGPRSTRQEPKPTSELQQEAVDKVEEEARSTPRGGVPRFNPNASPLALEAALDFEEHGQRAPELDPKIRGRFMLNQHEGAKIAGAPVQFISPNLTFGEQILEFVRAPGEFVQQQLDAWRAPEDPRFAVVAGTTRKGTAQRKKFINKRAWWERHHWRMKDRGDKESAMTSAFKMIMFADRAEGVTSRALTHGQINWLGDSPLNGFAKVEELLDEDGSRIDGLIGAFKPLLPYLESGIEYKGETVDPLYLFGNYAAAKRIEELKESRARLPGGHPGNPKVRQEIIDFGDNNQAISNAYRRYELWNNQLITFGQKTGLLNERQAEHWRTQMAYYPFYREADLGHKHPFQEELKGSETDIQEHPLKAIPQNAYAIIYGGMVNAAKLRLLRNLESFGEATVVSAKEASGRPDMVMAKENGESIYWRVDDPEMYDSLMSAGDASPMPWISTLAKPANFLREMVTRDPGFMGVNIMRDTLTTWVTSGADYKPFVDSIKNAFGGDLEMLYDAGVAGQYDFSSDPGNMEKFTKDALRKQQRDTMNGGLNPITMFSRMWDGLGRASAISDAATRKAVYDKVLKTTEDEAEALFQALEVINFSRRGDNQLMRILTATIPFLNARIQGLDVLYRSGVKGRYTAKVGQLTPQEIRMGTIKRGSMLMGMTALYWLMVHDDDEYRNQRIELRDDNWIIPLGKGLPAITIPIPFEVGVLFKTIPERALDLAFGSTTDKEFVNSMVRSLKTTFEFNPLGFQFLAPLWEAYSNRSGYTGRAIVPYYMQEQIEPGQQSRPETNALLTELGKALNISPIQMEYVLSGYGGTMGAYLLQLADAVTRVATGKNIAGTRADLNPLDIRSIDNFPVLKRFFERDDYSRGVMQRFYEMRNELDMTIGTINKLKDRGKTDELMAYRESRMGLLASQSRIRSLERQLTRWRKQRQRVLDADPKDIPYQQKKEMLEAIERRIESMAPAVEMISIQADLPVRLTGT